MVRFGRSGGENLCLQPKCPIHSDQMNRTILALSCLHPFNSKNGNFVTLLKIKNQKGVLAKGECPVRTR
jgi:hypothetical protein